jgi:hypothetical protein
LFRITLRRHDLAAEVWHLKEPERAAAGAEPRAQFRRWSEDTMVLAQIRYNAEDQIEKLGDTPARLTDNTGGDDSDILILIEPLAEAPKRGRLLPSTIRGLAC